MLKIFFLSSGNKGLKSCFLQKYGQTAEISNTDCNTVICRCVKNCEGQTNSGEVLYMKATCSKHCTGADNKGFYQWKVVDDDVKESDTELGLNVDKLIVKENILTPGRNYTITVTGKFIYLTYTECPVKRFTLFEC